MKKATELFAPLALIFILSFSFDIMPLSGQGSDRVSADTALQTNIQTCLEQDRHNAGLWWYGWLGAYSTATIVQGALCISGDNKQFRQDMALGSATTLLGALGQIVTPLVKKESDINQYNCETLFLDLAEKEKAGRSWKVHAVTGAVNIGSGLITWLGFKRSFSDGVENFLLNTAITEAQIWTQPVRAAKDYQRYYGKNAKAVTPLNRPRAEWYVGVYPGGISVNMRF